MNYQFNLDEWLPRFPLDRDAARYSGGPITSPWDVCNNELLRRELQDQFDWGPAIPVDVFVMAEGEPQNRAATKIGGLPYRPATMRWPISNDKPLLFLAQFNFTDSTDLTGELPGDLLLVFAIWEEGLIEELHCEWHHLGLPDLITAEAIPTHPCSFDPCYGHRFRTVSYPHAEQRPASKFDKYPTCFSKEVWSSYWLLQYQANQIGAAPYFIQPGDDELPGRPLCTISSVQPDRHKPFPWINHPQPLLPEGQWSFDDRYLMIGDLGCIYISIDDSGELYWGESCF